MFYPPNCLSFSIFLSLLLLPVDTFRYYATSITPIHVLAVTSLAYPFRSPSIFIVVVVISVIVISFGHTCPGAQGNFTRV